MNEKVIEVFDYHYNNRMPKYQEKAMPPFHPRHAEIVDGVRVWVDGKKLNPYKGIDARSLSLRSRIETGTFETHEGSARSLEKAQGSDLLSKQIAQAEKQYVERKQKYEEFASRKRLREATEEFMKKNAPKVTNDTKD